MTGAAVLVATTGVLRRRDARAAGLPRHLALAVTEHDEQGRKTRKVFDCLRDYAAAVPVGTVPPPAVRPEANVAGVLETVAGLVAKGAGAIGEQVTAKRGGSR